MSNSSADPITQDELHFNRRALVSRLHAAVLSVFVGRCRNCGFSLEAFGKRLGKAAADIGMILDSPEQWTLDTVSDLLLAMDCEAHPRVTELLFTGWTPPEPQKEVAHG